MHTTAHMEAREQLWGAGTFFLSFRSLGPKLKTPLSKCPCPEPSHQLTCKLLMKTVTEVLVALRRMCDVGRHRALRRRNMINVADPRRW